MRANLKPASRNSLIVILVAGFVVPAASAANLNCNLNQYQPLEGLAANVESDELVVHWDGESGQKLRARFTIHDGIPTVQELAVQPASGSWQILARNLTPDIGVTTGIRRTNHGLPEENRWDVFWDTPLNRPSEVRRFVASFHAEQCAVRTDGARLEITFPGLAMGIFSGSLQFTVYRGTNLLRVEAMAKTDEPSVAYKYEAGLKGFSAELLPRVVWRDVRNEPQVINVASSENGNQVVLRARNRLSIAEGVGGCVAVFPPPHQFFFARELEVNLGYVWYRQDENATFSLGVRHADKEEGYNPA